MARNNRIVLLVVFFMAVFRITGKAQSQPVADSLSYYLDQIRNSADSTAISGTLAYLNRSPESVLLKDEVLNSIEKARTAVDEKTYFDLVLAYFNSLEKINSAATNEKFLEKGKIWITKWSSEKTKYGRYSYYGLFRNYRLPFRNTGNLTGAIEYFNAMEKQFLAKNDSAGVSIAANVLAGFYFRLGILERGKYYMLKSVDFLNEKQEDYALHTSAAMFGLSGKLNRYAVLGHFYLKENLAEEAIGYLQKAMGYFHQLDTVYRSQDVPFLFLQMGRCKTLQKNDSSSYYYDKAFEYLREYKRPELEIAGFYQEKTADLISRNQFDSAMTYINRAIHLKDSLHLPVSSYFGELMVGYYKSQILLKKGQAREAIPLLETEIESLRQLNLKNHLIKEYVLMAQVYKAAGETDKAYKAIDHALTLKEEVVKGEQEARSLSFEAEKKMQESENTIQLLNAQNRNNQKIKVYLIGIVLLLGLLAAGLAFFYRNKRKNNRELSLKNERLAYTLDKLQATQSQLVQSEKMASLGELTAGIAHEIQNPLNFVNNFSELNQELATELVEEAGKGNTEMVKQIAADIKSNAEKINHHGKRADGIVKGMLQHSRSSNGQEELTDINALCDEYLRLAYHGWRAKDHSFNARFETEFDPSITKISMVPQDIGRVILNLFNNAFFAVNERSKALQTINGGVPYEPTVEVRTLLSPGAGKEAREELRISIRDNGTGIPPLLVEKIFQPFFTTKPTGQGTGLGLSLSYDIIKAHGGEIKVESEEGKGTVFIITLPVKNSS